MPVEYLCRVAQVQLVRMAITTIEIKKFNAYIQSICDHSPGDEHLRVVIRGANHFTFSDDGALLKSRIILSAFRFLGKLGMDGRRQLAVTAYCVSSFFNEQLKGIDGNHFKKSHRLYPEIQVLD